MGLWWEHRRGWLRVHILVRNQEEPGRRLRPASTHHAPLGWTTKGGHPTPTVPSGLAAAHTGKSVTPVHGALTMSPRGHGQGSVSPPMHMA